jgi:hypothetical protein
MNTSTRRLFGGLAAAAVVLLGQGGFVRAASPSASVGPAPSGPSGNEMLSIQPSLISVSAKPGTTTSTTLTLRAAAALDVNIKTQGLAQSADGAFKSVPDAQDTSALSARTMITASPQALSVKPGDTVKVTVNVVVPANAGDGTRYAILTVTGLPAGAGASSNVGFGVELGVSAILEVAGTTPTKTGEIKGITVGKALPGQPLPVDVSFLNTGNTHYGATPNSLLTTATLQDAAGATLATSSADGNQLSVVPPFTRDVALSMTPSQPLVDRSRYHIEVGVGLKDGTVFDRKALDFTWSGGAVLSATGAPIQTPPAAAPATPSDQTGTIIAAALLGAAVVVLFVLILPRAFRRRRMGSGAGGK